MARVAMWSTRTSIDGQKQRIYSLGTIIHTCSHGVKRSIEIVVYNLPFFYVFVDSLPTDNATILTSHGTVEGTKVEEKIEQNTKQNETKERRKSPRPTSKENGQSKSGKAAHSDSTGK
jgi:hypothetical protein